MKSPKAPKTPPIQPAVPVAQLDDPGLVDVKRRTRASALEREGSRASLLTSGGSRGVLDTSGDRKRKQLGYGSLAGGGSPA